MSRRLSALTLSVWLLLVTAPLQFSGMNREYMGVSRAVTQVAQDVPGICASAVNSYGYDCHEHQVTTKDGYILSLGRTSVMKNSQPVLVQHGVLVDGMTWFMNPADQNLPLILAENGFDVWIANGRGTSFSKRHVTLYPNSKEFWDWTWDEVVANDLPAMLDYVFTQTGQKLHYVGHSMGTLVALASLSEGNTVDKLRSVALLSPVAYLSHMTTPLGVAAARSLVGEIYTVLGIAEFNPAYKDVELFLRTLCRNNSIDCYDLLSALTGPNCCLNSSTVSKFLKHEPQSTSTKNMVHLSQIVRDGRICKYNYGNPIWNLVRYGSISPPEYDLNRIPKNFPMFISYGGRDALSDVKDVGELLDKLKLHDVGKLTVQYVKDYAHADYIMGVTAKDIVYNPIISFFKSHGDS